MTLSARQDLVRLARTFDALIVCDDVYDFLYWPTTSTSAPFQAIIPRLVDIDADIDGGTNRPGADGFGNVLSNGSFSKIAGPGVRTGWAEGNSFIHSLHTFPIIHYYHTSTHIPSYPSRASCPAVTRPTNYLAIPRPHRVTQHPNTALALFHVSILTDTQEPPP